MDQAQDDWRSRALIDALPYMREFYGTTVVVKYGGNSHSVGSALDSFANDIVFLRTVGINVVVVHGGGPQVDEALKKYGVESERIDGLRVTTQEVLEIARMVFVGQIGRELVTAINKQGGNAVGTTGEDGKLMKVHQLDERLGFVGVVDEINAGMIDNYFSEGIIPVIAPIGADDDSQSYNINADEAATAVAIGLKAKKIIFMSNIPGLLQDIHNPNSVISEISSKQAQELLDSGAISEGMIPKIRACVDAIDSGVSRAHIIDGRQPHSLLVELFSDAGIGTMFSENLDPQKEQND